MTEKIKAIRGMPDILPKDTALWLGFEQHWRQLVAAYGYEEIRFPIVESTGLFKRSIGEITDIVEKEMFTFNSKDNESLTLRPEGTAGCVRAGIEHGLLYHQVQRLWYSGPMFRYERPQKGRYRQFYQVGVEAFGLEGPDIDAEHIFMMKRLWGWLGVEAAVSLQVNSLGSSATRKEYRKQLIDYFLKYENELDEDSKRRLHTNPLRILDSKNAAMAEIIHHAPKCHEHLDTESRVHFEGFLQLLTDAGIPYTVNPNLVRGLDYYNRTVYEWVTNSLGAQGTVCGGGRYDNLVAQLGGEPTPGVGLSAGIDRIILLQQALGVLQTSGIDVYLLHFGDGAEQKAFLLAEKMRTQIRDLRLVVHCGGGNFKQQFKKADKIGARLAFILGEEEVRTNTIGVKFLREAQEQRSISINEIHQFLTQYLGR